MFSLADGAAHTNVSAETVSLSFQNPIAPGADPWVVRHGGLYYWCLSDRDLGVAVYRSDRLTSLGEKFLVWRAPDFGPHSREIWAPELHFIDGRWYIYVAASNGRNETHRMIVLEGTSSDPTNEFRFKSELYLGDHLSTGLFNRWAIDGTVFEHLGQRYYLWSGWHDHRDQQWLYIAKMANPWTIATNRVRLCANDDYLWERVDETPSGRGLNEGPQVLKRDGRVFVVFSASASWATSYKLGLLELMPGGDPLDHRAWHKYSEPVLQQSDSAWGVGHCSFTQSPDGSEDWIAFHAKVDTQPGWNRAIHVQRFDWTADGRPNFGRPVAPGAVLAQPAGALAPVLVDPAGTVPIERVHVVEVNDAASAPSTAPVSPSPSAPARLRSTWSFEG